MSDCQICDTQNTSFAWTDTHGVAQCMKCGTPYRLYHYEENTRVDKPPTMAVKPEWVSVLRQYWSESKRPVPSGHSFPGGYEIATRADADAWGEWLEAHSDILPKDDAETLEANT